MFCITCRCRGARCCSAADPEVLEIHGDDERSSEPILDTLGSMIGRCRFEVSVLEMYQAGIVDLYC